MFSATPLIDLRGDHHIHTSFCNHACGTMRDYVLSAIRRGLQSMTFLEHLECGILSDHRTWLTTALFKEYFKEGRALKKQYAGQISIRLGVEVGYNPAEIPRLQEILARFPFEHVGLSYHFYPAGNRHLNMVSSRQETLDALADIGINRVLDEYFNGLIQACSLIDCTKICHLDAVLRYMPNLCFLKRHEQQIEHLLHCMREKNIALEINTSGIAIRSRPYPAGNIVNLARSLGIPLIAGSDAHRPDQVARHFRQLTVF